MQGGLDNRSSHSMALVLFVDVLAVHCLLVLLLFLDDSASLVYCTSACIDNFYILCIAQGPKISKVVHIFWSKYHVTGPRVPKIGFTYTRT